MLLMRKELRMSSPLKRHAKQAAREAMLRMRRVRPMSSLLKRRAQQAAKEVMLRMRKELRTSSIQKKLAKQAGKVGNHHTAVDEAVPEASPPRLPEVELPSSTRRRVARAIRIARKLASNKPLLY
jgi:hypothetical protein